MNDREAIDELARMHHARDWRPLDGTYIGSKVCQADRLPWPCPTRQVVDRATAAREDGAA